MPASAAPSDEDLMLAYAAGDAAAFDTLYARHKGGVYRYLLRQCHHAGDCRDQPELRAENHELGKRLKNAVAALPPAQREAFLLHQEGGLSLAELAELTHVGVETVKSRLRYAVNKLRSDLSDLYEAQQ